MFRHLKPYLFLRRVVGGAITMATTTNVGRVAPSVHGVASPQRDISRPLAQQRGYASKSKDYYKTLGVDRNADIKAIKKAYRKRALETHPDQGGNKEEFAEVAEAYEVLSNPEKKTLYDQYGSEAATNPNMASGFGGRSAEEIFAEFFKGNMEMGGFGDLFRGRTGGTRGPPTVEPIEARLRLTLEEVATGVTKTIRVTRPQLCPDCTGLGTKSKTAKPRCAQCDGQGHVVQQHRVGPGMTQQTITECARCHGTGSLARPEDQCARCHGRGYRSVGQDVPVNVPAGIPSNVTMVLRGQGGSLPGAQDGDLHLHVEVSPHRVFQRRGDDLIVRKEINLAEALLGMCMPLKLLDGRMVNVETPADSVLKPNGVIKLAGEGLPSNTGGRGDIYVFIKLKMPDKLSSEQREHIKKALGAPSADPNASRGNTVKARVLRESQEQLEEQKRGVWEAHGRHGESDGHRRGSGPRGGQHVEQCTAQ